MKKPVATLLALLALMTGSAIASAAEPLYIAETSISANLATAPSTVKAGDTAGAALTTYTTSSTAQITRLAVGAEKIVWNTLGTSSAGGTISIGNRDGSGTPTIITLAANESAAGFAIDEAAGVVYATIGVRAPGTTANRVVKIGLAAPNTQTVLYDRGVSTTTLVSSIALDPTTGGLYWCEFPGPSTDETGSVMSGSVTGTGTPQALYTQEFGCNGIAVDTATKKLYWARYQTTGGSAANKTSLIRAGSTTGTAATTLFTEGDNSSSGLSLDQAAGTLYWANQPTSQQTAAVGSIRSGSVKGGTATDLYTGLVNPNDAQVPAGSGKKATATITKARAVKAHGIVMSVKVNGKGKVAVSGKRGTAVACTGTKTAARAGSITVTCRFTAATRAVIATRAIRVAVTATFTPEAGSAVTARQTVRVGRYTPTPGPVTG